ncbi:MAG: ABC transporter permease subunit, partial [Planctomycetia bacterium]
IGGTILLLVSLVITAGMVPTMVRKGTLELLLVRPVPRWQLLVFKFASGLLFVSALLGTLVACTWLVTGLLTGIWSPGIVLALPGLMLFFGLLLALAVLVGVVTRSTPAAILVAVAYWAVLFVVGATHAQVVASRLREANVGKPRPTSVADSLRGRRSEVVKPLEPGRTPFHGSLPGRLTESLYAVLPHTEDLDTMVDRQLMRDFAIGGRLRQLVESPDFTWLGGVGVTLVHAVAFLVTACTVFARRDP